MVNRIVGFVYLSLVALACSRPAIDTQRSDEPVAVSLMGKEFYEPERKPQEQAKLDSLMLIARKNFENDPTEENYIWYGRREGYLMHLHEAIAIFTEGIEKYPESYVIADIAISRFENLTRPSLTSTRRHN
jgi:hypothetical protein